jgi:arginase
MSKIQLFENTSEIGAGTRGASLGIDALKVACANRNDDLFLYIHSDEVQNEDNYLFIKDSNTCARRIEGVITMYKRIARKVAAEVKGDSFPIVLAGDHSNAGGTIAGIKKAYPNKNIGVVWIDAHADMHTPYTSPSGNIHGMPLATALGMDNIANQKNEPDFETQASWNNLKNTGSIQPKIKPEHLAFIAVRDTEIEEDNFIVQNGIKNFPVEEVRNKGIAQVITEIEEQMSNCELIYISFDVDSMDSSISRGTGTPVENGLTVEEAKELVTTLGSLEKTCCVEFTEINPTLDTKNKMAEHAFMILKALCEKIDPNYKK